MIKHLWLSITGAVNGLVSGDVTTWAGAVLVVWWMVALSVDDKFKR